MGKVIPTSGAAFGFGPPQAARQPQPTRSGLAWRLAFTSALRALSLLLGGLALGVGPVWAQCNQSNLLNYATATVGTRKTATESVSNTAFTYSGYTSTSPAIRTFGVQTVANFSGTSLVWQEDNQNVPLPNQASITLTFTRPVDNLTLRLQNLDADANAYFRDNLKLDGYPTATGGSPATLTASNFTLGSKNAFAGAGTNTVRGTAPAAAGDATANVTVAFTTPVQRLVLTYSNDIAYTANVLRPQTIGINSIAWCAQADVQTTLTGPARAQAGSTVAYTATTRNVSGDQMTTVRPTVQLPTGLSSVAVSGGGSYSSTTGRVTFPTIATQAVGTAGKVTNTIASLFPTTATTVTGTVTTGTTEQAGTLADNTAVPTTGLTNQQPLANAFANRLQTPESNTATALILSALGGYDPDGAIGSFTITSLPAAAAGALLLRGTTVAMGQVISLADAANLSFDPLATFVGTAFFIYTATDNQGAVWLPATYTIIVGQDNASAYTSTPVKGGVNQYQNGDVIANVFDDNGGAYNAAAAVTDNGVRTATMTTGSTLPNGLELDPATGQVRVLDRTLLVTGTYPVTISTVDTNGGVTTQAVAIRIGAFPLPVQFIRFEARALGADAQLSWTTAQELNNKGFRVERSFDGVSFVQLDFVVGADTATTTKQRYYTYAEVGVGRQRPGNVYYRLQQVDLSGKATYSPVRAVVFAPEAFSIFPNPTHTCTTLNLSSLPTTTFDVTLVGMAGRVVQAHTLAGGQAHKLKVSSLPSGAYLIIVRRGSLKLMRHLLKQ